MESKKRLKKKKAERRNRMTKRQQDFLIEFLSDNRDMISEKGLNPPSNKWTELTNSLNKMGNKKPVVDWIDAYKLLSRKIRLKHKRRNADPLKFSVKPVEHMLLSLEGIIPPSSSPITIVKHEIVDNIEPPIDEQVKEEVVSSDDSISMASSTNALDESNLQMALETSTRELCSAIRSLGDSIILAAKIIVGKEE